MPELTNFEKELLSASVPKEIGIERSNSNDYYYEITPGNLITVKLLHSLLETMKEIQDELKQMRKTNERLEKIISSAVTPAYPFHNSNNDPKAILVKKV